MIPVQHVHPMLVHFPIVLVFLLVAFDGMATIAGKQVTGRTIAGNISTAIAALAGISAVAAYYFGDLALSFAEAGGFESDVAETHEGLGRMVAVGLAAWAIARIGLWVADIRFKGPVSYLVPALSTAATALVVVTAYYGGQLVFDLGVNVARAAAGA